MYGQCVVNVRSMCGQNVQSMYGQCVVKMYSQCMVNVWSMYGQCVVNVRSIHSQYTVNTLVTRSIHGAAAGPAVQQAGEWNRVNEGK